MRKTLISLIVGVGFFATVCYAAGLDTAEKSKVDSVYKELDLFGESLALIQQKYVEDKEFKDLIYGALAGVARSLDSYSQFLEPDEYKDLLVETEGKFGGLGIEITLREGVLTIVSPIEETPAYKAGLKPGDVIVKIEGEVTKGITLNEAVKKMRGDPGTEITITIFREKERLLKDVPIVRDIIKIRDIRRAQILTDGIGYVKLAEFRENTARDLSSELKKIDKEDLQAIILDLRNNPGGLLVSAIEVASKFLEDGKIVVSTKSRDGETIFYKSLPSPKKYIDMPMVVLINGGSASGSEIVAAALRENKRAVLLGEKSFGKASVQSVIPLSDGSALRLTTAKYYTPEGKSIHEIGVEPDIVVTKEVADEESPREDVFKEIENNKEEEFDYSRDYQLLRAVDLIKGLMVLSPPQQ